MTYKNPNLRIKYKKNILVVLSVFTAFQRLVLHLNNLFLLASTFKPNGSSSSTDENKENTNYKA